MLHPLGGPPVEGPAKPGISQSNILFDSLQPSYSEVEAANLVVLLHTFTPEQQRDPNTYQLLLAYLEARKPGLKEVAHWTLCHLAQQGRQFGFNALASPEQNRNAVAGWRKLIPPDSLPPAPGK